MAVVNKRVFDTDNALHATFNRYWGRWQIITYIGFVLAYAIVIGWLNNLNDYTLLVPSHVECNYTSFLSKINYSNRSIIQRLSGKSRYIVIENDQETTAPFNFNYSTEFGNSVATDFEILCDIEPYLKVAKFVYYFGLIIGSVMLGIASDMGGRKIIILACIWTSGIMSVFQLVGHDYVSYVFFQFFLGLFVGGVQASFLPAIVEMFPINFRTFYGVAFHSVVSLFSLVLPWLAKSFKNWKFLQIFVTSPVLLTAVLQFFVYESIFWFLAHKEYDRVIELLARLAKRNGIEFSTKFPQADEFKHAKHSKATQVDILPLLRLQDVELLGKKYPQIDMVELQKQKANSSKIRRILNSFKGASYRSTNTIYRPLDFIYSPTLLTYVIILGGLWLTNGLTDSMEIPQIKGTVNEVKIVKIDFYVEMTIQSLISLIVSVSAIFFAIFKFGRKIPIFSAYLVIEVCLLGSFIAEYNTAENDEEKNVALIVLYYVCRFSSYFGLIFLMLITAELFPTSLRCTGVGICFALKMLGSLIAHPDLLAYNTSTHRLIYCILTLFFGSVTLFLPETKSYPLPRSILQIEAMPTTIGKKLRSRKVQLACERRQIQYMDNKLDVTQKKTLLGVNDSNVLIMQSLENQRQNSYHLLLPKSHSEAEFKIEFKTGGGKNKKLHGSSGVLGAKTVDEPFSKDTMYDTVTSFHDIEQDDHKYYNKDAASKLQGPKKYFKFDRSSLGKINELPSKKDNTFKTAQQ